jgi:hypothetical protein
VQINSWRSQFIAMQIHVAKQLFIPVSSYENKGNPAKEMN